MFGQVAQYQGSNQKAPKWIQTQKYRTIKRQKKNQPQDHIYIYISTGWSAFTPLQAPLETKKNEKSYSTIVKELVDDSYIFGVHADACSGGE